MKNTTLKGIKKSNSTIQFSGVVQKFATDMDK